MLTLDLIVPLAYFALLALVVAAASRFGGQPEKAVAAVMAALSIAYPIVALAGNFRGLQVGLLLLDLFALSGLFWIALCADRWWTLGATALQLDGVVDHFAMWISPAVMPWAYALLLQLSSWMILVLLAGGIGAYRFRTRAGHSNRDWLRSPRWMMVRRSER